MPDWPPAPLTVPTGGTIHVGSPACLLFDCAVSLHAAYTVAAAWPSANLALYIPFMVETTVTAYKMAFEVGAQAGNCDVGIYDVLGNRLVSAGSTPVGAAGLQTIDITDTILTPAVYFMAMSCDTVTTLTIMRFSGALAAYIRSQGLQQEALGSVTLPNPATFANPGSAYIPSLAVALKATI